MIGQVVQCPWSFPGVQVVGKDAPQKASIVIFGRSGVGKSRLVRQLLEDADYGPEAVLVVMAEDATAVYGPGARILRVKNTADAETAVDLVIGAASTGSAIPKVLVVDSVSGIALYQRQYFKTHPISGGPGRGRDTRAEFGDLGYGLIDFIAKLRDSVPCDCVSLVTTFEKGEMIDMAVDGNLLPRTITSLSNVALYMRAVEVNYDPMAEAPKPAKHRTIVVDENGAPTGKLINRYFLTQDTGEVMAKGHDGLLFRERAILPDVLRKIHGIKAT